MRPHDNVSVRFEYRHDLANSPLYFRGDVRVDQAGANVHVANARTQSTLLVGATAWF